VLSRRRQLDSPNPEENTDKALFDKLGIVANGEQHALSAAKDIAAA